MIQGGAQDIIVILCYLIQGGEQVELIPGGADIDVTVNNVHDYVRKYAEYRMVKSAEKCLEVCHNCVSFCDFLIRT